MNITQSKHLKIKLNGKDADVFKSLLKALHEQSKKIGFTNNFTHEQQTLINDLNNKLDQCNS